MITLPQGSYFKQTNESDRSGELWATRNMNFDEAGVARLSLRSISIFNDVANDATEGLAGDASLGSSWGGIIQPYATATGGSYYVHTSDNDFLVDQNLETGAVTEDTGAPASSNHGGVAAWQGEVYVGGTTTVHSRTSGGSWTSRVTGLTSGVARPLCVVAFAASGGELAVGDGSTVKSYSTAHANTATLNVPANHEVTCIAATNNSVFVGTKNYAGKALVVDWDGDAAIPRQIYPIDATEVRSIRIFGGVPVITTNKGQVLEFNGAGFSSVANWPVFSSRLRLGQNSGFAGGLVDDGDILLASVDMSVGDGTYMPESPSGIHCFDKNVGLYHRHSFTGARRQILTVAAASVNTTTNVMTVGSGTVPATGTPVAVVSSDAPAGLTSGTLYYTVNASSSTLKLATTKTLADAGTGIDITSQGSGTHYLYFYPNSDFGQSIVDDSGSVCVMEFPPNEPVLGSSLIFSSDSMSRSMSDDCQKLQVLVEGPENRGYLTTTKIFSSNVTDAFSSVTVKARGVTKDIDKVIVKYRVEDGSPYSYPVDFYTTTDCGTWTSTTTFTWPNSYRDLSYVEVGDEVEFIQGAGAGYLAHVTAIALAGGTWTVTIDETIQNIAASDTCRAVFTNFKKLGEMTSADEGFKRFGIDKKGKFLQLKVELRGYDVGIEDLQVVSAPDKKLF